jgi:predicted dehydrogenase
MAAHGHGSAASGDTLSLQLAFADGSIGTVHYFANGPKSFPKERLEVFAGGRALQLDNFRKLTGFGWPGFGKMNLWRQDKGQKGGLRDRLRAGSVEIRRRMHRSRWVNCSRWRG